MANSNDNLRNIAVNSETAEPASKRNDQVKMGDSFYEDQHSAHIHSAHEIQSAKTPTGLFSEHGHSLTHIRPMAKHSGSSVATFFTGLHTTIIGISSLGASVTFSYVLSNNTQDVPSQSPRFSKEQVQQFLAISWLLFLLGLAFASLGSTLLTFFKSHWIADWDGFNGKNSQWQVQMYAVLASGVMGGLIIGAFIVLGLVVVAYSPIVGWIAVGFTAAFGLFILLAIINQAPWPWRDNTPSQTHRHRTV
jgi:MFS family permease